VKALSLKQPWAFLLVYGYKDIENRTWSTKFRGRVYIHASKTIDKPAFEWIAKNIPLDIIQKFMPGNLPDNRMFTTGAIIGEIDITDCVTSSDSQWFFGPYGFKVANPVAYDKPIPCKGMLGFFEPVI